MDNIIHGSFRRIQKRIFDPRFARFRGRKEREIRNWICNLGNLSPTRAICTTASQKMTCFLFDNLYRAEFSGRQFE